ncbi:acyl-CoA dehydrogenase family protein [Streptomyces sp. NRRL S-37]|uniref:acyl-CoA dehydrogenase family protein n=1 Tax=Streptomyces sp. NRRL S-37 TaxID=1463903 RepID=UPI0004C99E16|nr:acyl-CoA dehydrogenase family protein [Streptomyces sp. NRRL S-37]
MPETPSATAALQEALLPFGADACPHARDVWKTLAASGLVSALYNDPSPDARWGLDPERLRTTLTALDAVLPLGVTLSFCVQAATALPLLLDAPPDSLAGRTAAEATAGQLTLALAATDSDAAGSDLTAMGTRLEQEGDTLVLTGGKRWIVNALTADQALVLARRRPGKHFTHFSLLLVPLTASGVRVEPADTLWFDGAGIGSLHFDGVRLPTDHLIGSPSRGLAAFARRINTERLASGLWANALAARVLSQTRQMLTRRRIAGAPQWDNAAVRQEFATVLLDQQRLDALCEKTYSPAPDAPPPAAAAALLKAAGAETLDRVLTVCARLQGAQAFARDGLHHLRTEAAMFGIAGGTSHTLRDLIADHAETLLDTRNTAS